MNALAISLVAGAALCSVMSMPVSAMPMSNLAAAASELEQSNTAEHEHPSNAVSNYPYDQCPGYRRDQSAKNTQA